MDGHLPGEIILLANSGVVVSVNEMDFKIFSDSGALSGLRFQQWQNKMLSGLAVQK